MPFFQDADAKLTLTRIARAPVLIAEIAQLTGNKLEVSPSLSQEVLIVSVADAYANEVLTKLAIAATARWEPSENGYRLVADNAARGIEASSERARRLQAIQDGPRKKKEQQAKQIAEMKAEAAKSGEKLDMSDFDGMFGGRTVDDFVPLLDQASLAAMEPGDRIVFATNPNSAQRPIRGNPAPLVAAWIAEHNKNAKAMSSGDEEMPEEVAALMKGPLGERMRRMSQPIKGVPVKILAVASRGANSMFGGMGTDIRLEVRAYAANGDALIEESGSIDTDMLSLFAQLGARKTEATGGSATPIVYSEDTKAFLAMKNTGGMTMGGGLGIPKMPPSLREKLFAPDKFEPLGLLPGEGLVALSKARRKPLVGSLPDAAFPGILRSGSPTTVEEVEESLRTGALRLVPDTTFFVVKPSEPDAARRSRLDRFALKSLMGAIADHETPTLGELADFAAKSAPPARNALTMSYLMTFAPGTMGSMAGIVSWDALRLYAALSSSQRDSLAQGAKIPFANLSPAAHSALRALLYGAGDNLTIERPGVTDEPDVFGMSMKMMMGGGAIDAREEPTEIAPRGLPASGFLQAIVSTDTIVRPVGPEGAAYYSLGTDELAMFKMISSSPIAERVGDTLKLPEAGRLGTRTLWNLRGYIAPGAYVGSVLTDDRTPRSGQQVSLSALPSDLQAKVAQKMEKLKKSPLGAIMSMGAAFGKPPVQP